jgi:hypothetical protein
LKNNQLRELPDSMRDLTNLDFLSLEMNHFTSLPEFIADLNICRLHLRKNSLTSLPTLLLPNWLNNLPFTDDVLLDEIDLDFDLLPYIPANFYETVVILAIPNEGIYIRTDTDRLPSGSEFGDDQ